MSGDIDIQNYMGALNPAAGEQVDQNSYQQEYTDDAVVHEQFLEKAEEAPQIELSKQELNFAALRQEVDRIKAEKEAEKREYQLQLDMLRANMSQQQAPQPPKRTEMFEGKDQEYVPNVEEIRREWNQREAGYQARLEELEFQSLHPDYAEVMSKYAIPLVRQKPHLAEGLRGAENKAMFAYELGKMAQQLAQVQSTPPQTSENARRIVENAKQPGHMAMVGGQATLSKAEYYSTMSDAEFAKIASRHLEGI